MTNHDHHSGRGHAVVAGFLGWTLDAFDFFLLVFLKVSIGREFGATDEQVSELLFLTLAARPFGAFVFGWLADRSRSLAAPMLAHLAINEAGAIAVLAARSSNRRLN